VEVVVDASEDPDKATQVQVQRRRKKRQQRQLRMTVFLSMKPKNSTRPARSSAAISVTVANATMVINARTHTRLDLQLVIPNLVEADVDELAVRQMHLGSASISVTTRIVNTENNADSSMVG